MVPQCSGLELEHARFEVTGDATFHLRTRWTRTRFMLREKKKSSETHMTDIRAISVVLPRCIVIITILTSTTSSDANHRWHVDHCV